MTTEAGTDPALQRPVDSLDQLEAWFAAGEKPRDRWGVGLEYERLGVEAETGRAIPYFGSRSVGAVLEDLAARGWNPTRENDHIIALEREGTRLTLEPGGQTELSSRVHQRLGDLRDELCAYVGDLASVARPRGIRWLGLGLHPFSRREEIAWIPKKRYRVMSAHLERTGALGHDMMKRTAGIQLNFDYDSEEDAARRFRLLMALTPVVTALFANSPLDSGHPTGWLSSRARVWLDTDPSRCGLLPFAFEARPLYAAYRDWALDVPMMFVIRDGTWMAVPVSFRRFVAEGHQGLTARLADWELHLTTLFPEVRLKRYIETRSIDSGDASLALAATALLQGLAYDDRAGGAAWELLADVPFAARQAAQTDAARSGLAARHGATPLRELATALVALAAEGLARQTDDAARARADQRLLAPLEQILADDQPPALRLLRDWESRLARDPARLVEELSGVHFPCHAG